MKKITGVIIYYYHICQRKLWYFMKDLNMEKNSELVSIGKHIDETSYSREKKNLLIDEHINIDFIDNWSIIHEVKKSKKMEEASLWQIKYYIFILKQKGVHIEKGIIDYPLLRKKVEVYLTDEDEQTIKKIIKEIEGIYFMELPPKISKKSICKKCAYFEFCYI